MKKYIFISKNNNKLYFSIIFILLFFLIIYFIFYYKITNQKYFTINNFDYNSYYIIPEDKGGEKVKFINKKSINNLSSLNEINKIYNIKDLKYTIQLFSDINYNNVEDYINKLLDSKSDIISSDQLYVFNINSQIGIDYFLTYKNFNSKIEAITYCKKLSFVKKCLIVNPQKINNF